MRFPSVTFLNLSLFNDFINSNLSIFLCRVIFCMFFTRLQIHKNMSLSKFPFDFPTFVQNLNSTRCTFFPQVQDPPWQLLPWPPSFSPSSVLSETWLNIQIPLTRPPILVLPQNLKPVKKLRYFLSLALFIPHLLCQCCPTCVVISV